VVDEALKTCAARTMGSIVSTAVSAGLPADLWSMKSAARKPIFTISPDNYKTSMPLTWEDGYVFVMGRTTTHQCRRP